MYVTGLGGRSPTSWRTQPAPHTLSQNLGLTQTHDPPPSPSPERRLDSGNREHQDGIEAAMVKCLIRITTRVNVHLRMINHCYRDVKVRVLSLGPRMLGKALGVLPLYPALTGLQEPASSSPLPGPPLCVEPCYPPGKATPWSHGGVCSVAVQISRGRKYLFMFSASLGR